MSLHPYIFKYFKFPVGRTIIQVEYACKYIEARLRMDGLIKSSIVPPEKLYHLVLPFRCNNKFMFYVYRTSILTSSSEECEHTADDDCALPGTLVMVEVWLAVAKGLRLIQIYEVYEYQVTQYNPEIGEG